MRYYVPIILMVLSLSAFGAEEWLTLFQTSWKEGDEANMQRLIQSRLATDRDDIAALTAQHSLNVELGRLDAMVPNIDRLMKAVMLTKGAEVGRLRSNFLFSLVWIRGVTVSVLHNEAKLKAIVESFEIQERKGLRFKSQSIPYWEVIEAAERDRKKVKE